MYVFPYSSFSSLHFSPNLHDNEGKLSETQANVSSQGGQPNMYMQNHRCKVTGSTSTKTLGAPQAPVWCKDDPSKCVAGPKQMMAWNRKYFLFPRFSHSPSSLLIYLPGSRGLDLVTEFGKF
jgi:hypothetical protein